MTAKHVTRHTLLVGEVVGEVSISHACTLLRIEHQFFEALVDEGVFEVADPNAPLRRSELRRLRTAARLFHDLGVNAPGIAIILELLERQSLGDH